MNADASFSVIITCYNYKDFVVEAVASVLAQSRSAAQIIVVDDGSTDGSGEVLRQRYSMDTRVTLLFGDNGGQLVAFKRGVAAATGQVICFLDADDRWRADYLAKIGALYDARPDVDFVFTDVQQFGNEQGRIRFADKNMDLGQTAIVTYMTGFWYGAPTSALSLRAKWARRVLDLPEHFHETFRISADNCLGYGASVLGAHKYFLATDGSVEYRIHGNNAWWAQQDAARIYLHMLFRSCCLIEIYADRVGLREDCRNSARKELATKPRVDWSEARRYASITRHRENGRRKEYTIRRVLKTMLFYALHKCQ